MTRTKLGVPVVVGIPFDGESSYLRGAGDAPPKIREAMWCDASNMWTELGLDLGVSGIFEDAGDLKFGPKNAHPAQNQIEIEHPVFSEIEAAIAKHIDAWKRPVALGGDHSITFPIVK